MQTPFLEEGAMTIEFCVQCTTHVEFNESNRSNECVLQGKNLGKCATMMNELTEAGGSDCDEVPSDPS